MTMGRCESLDIQATSMLNEKSPLIAKANGENHRTRESFLYFAAFAVGLILVSTSSFTVWTSPVLKKLKSNSSDENPLGTPISTYQTSLLAGALTLGFILGPFVLKLLLDKHGRKRTLLILSTIAFLSNTAMAFSDNFSAYCIFRGVIGVCSGGWFMVIPIYITEITQDHNRGKFGVIVCIFVSLGQLYGYVAGPPLSVRMFTLVCAAPLFISICLVGLLLPDSPVHLVSTGQTQKALQALRKLRPDTYGRLEDEILIISQRLKSTNIANDGFLSLMKNSHFRVAFFIILGLKMTSALSGMLVISAFIGPIFNEANVGISGDTVAVLSAAIELLTLLFTSSLIERVGRRTLLLVSAMGSSVCQAVIGYYFHLRSYNEHFPSYFSWMAVISLSLFYIIYNMGLGCVPKILSGEIFPINVRATAVAVTSFIYSLLVFCGMFAFPLVQDSLGTAYCFWLFSSFCFLGFWFTYFMVPETKGRNISEILERRSSHNLPVYK